MTQQDGGVFARSLYAGLIVLATMTIGVSRLESRNLQSTSPSADPESALLKQYCVTCHNQRAKTADLSLDTMDVSNVAANAATWEKVVRKIRTGMMPPAGVRRPARAALDAFAAELETRLDRAAVPGANLGTPALHRLNRTEYANAIRDLFALDVDVTTLLPADGSSEGFDNIAEALGVSPSLIQGYVSAAMKISRQAVGDRTLSPYQVTYPAPGGLSHDRHIEGLPLGTRGGMLVRHTFPLDAEYEFTVAGGGQGGAVPGGIIIDITLDGEAMAAANPRKFTMKVPAGPHTIGIALVDRQRSAGVDEVFSDFRTDAVFTNPGSVQSLLITGPFKSTGAGDTPSRRRIFVCHPDSSGVAPNSERACARKILTTLARRAYRGPVSDAEIETLMSFYQQGRQDSAPSTGSGQSRATSRDDFETGIQHAIARVLVAPRFVYRVEEEPEKLPVGAVYPLSNLELASRLSFFLWSSIPDDELLDVAAKGRLRDRTVIERQVKRMLADPKSESLIKNFAGQWLYLRELANVETEAKNFDENLRQAFRRETEMLFGAIVREDRSLLDLLDANYTFVDERLARHYNIPNVRGSYFRRVTLEPSSPRRGLLGHGSMLTVTSVATRTSPVSRGKWILENLLGTPPPVPPPGVETNLGEGEANITTSLRQRLEQHRANPVCASCHRIMDPLGFSLENFDLVGTWREFDGSTRIDASGQLADGTALNGPADLRQALLSRSDAFVTTATEKLLTYALGRPVQHTDMPTVRSIVRHAAENGNRFSSIMLGVIESEPFQMRRKGALKTEN
jgi:hypothetical protein